jgi:hypothetical protein
MSGHRLTVICSHRLPALRPKPDPPVCTGVIELAEWDQGNAFSPVTSWQVSNTHGGTGGRIIPGDQTSTRFAPNPRPSKACSTGSVLSNTSWSTSLKWTVGGCSFDDAGRWWPPSVNRFSTRPGLLIERSTTGKQATGVRQNLR